MMRTAAVAGAALAGALALGGVSQAATTGQIQNFYSHKCLDVRNADQPGGWQAGDQLQQWTCGAAGGVDQQFQIITVGGTQVLQAIEPKGATGTVPPNGWCVTAYALEPTNAHMTIQPCGNTASGRQTLDKSGPFYQFPDSTGVMDGSGYSKVNGTYVIGHAKNTGTTSPVNQEWSLP